MTSMEAISAILHIFHLILLVYMGGATLYLLVFAIAGSLRRKEKVFSTNRFRDITIIIPAFMEDPVIIEVVKSALQQDYPRDRFHVILVADSFKTDTLDQLRRMDLKLVEVSFELSTKAKSLKASLEHLEPATELILVLDADNIMEDHFLQKINAAAESPYKITQCHRVAKNINNSFALLDAISEEVNNNIFRNGHRALGMSSALIGSAMVFDARMFRTYIPRLNAVGGFDKELELMILRDKVKIEYLKDAYVLDEKVQSAHVFYKQRKRWIYSQFYFFGRDFLKSVYHLIAHGNVDYFDKTLQFSLPPRVLLLGIVLLASIVTFVTNSQPFSIIWLALLLVLGITLIVSTPAKYQNFQTLQSMMALPGIFLLMVLILLRIKGSNKEFIHTDHNFPANHDNTNNKKI